MDITVEYTEEEKKLFDEVQQLKERVHLLEDEAFLLRKEHEEHTLENHTQGTPPIVYMVAVIICITIFICDLIVGIEFEMIHFAAAIAVASCAPTLAVFFSIMFAISYRKYYYQVVKSKKGRQRAAELEITNYYTEEERIMKAYERAKADLDLLKGIYKEKRDALDLLIERKTREAEEARLEVIKRRSSPADLKVMKR